jgi:hypothetical protein
MSSVLIKRRTAVSFLGGASVKGSYAILVGPTSREERPYLPSYCAEEIPLHLRN